MASALESLSKFSAFVTLKLDEQQILFYTINSSLSSYAELKLDFGYFAQITVINNSMFASAFKISLPVLFLNWIIQSLLSILKSKKASGPIQLIFSQSSLLALFKTTFGGEKIYKVLLEQVDFVQAVVPQNYPIHASILTRTFSPSLAPHSLLSRACNELEFTFASDQLTVISREEKSLAKVVTRHYRSDFYQYDTAENCVFTVIKSEFMGILESVGSRESLLGMHFGHPDSPIFITIEGFGEHLKLSFIMSTMTESSSEATKVRDAADGCVVEESDHEDNVLHFDDELAIPATPEYTY